MSAWMRAGVLVGISLWGAGFVGAQTLATGDSRTVTEPVFPPVCTTLTAQQAMTGGAPVSETTFDTARVQAALTACASGSAVELALGGTNNAFLIQPINVPSGVSLIVDGGVTVFASRNPADFQSSHTEQCGGYGPSGNGCNTLISFNNGGTNVGSGIYGYGVIDGRGGSTMLGGPNAGITWWANADNAAAAGENQDNMVLMSVGKSTNFTLYKITLRNSPMFHFVWSGNGLTAWDVKIATPFSARNTDGIDPSGTNVTVNLSSISDGDDNFAINASNAGSNMTVENTNTYSGHGISIGSYTQGGFTNLLVNNVNMAGTAADGNATGIRLKSAEDRGGLLKTITYENMCLKDMRHILQFTPFYDTNTGTLYPSFQNIVLQNLHFLTPTTNQNPYLVQMEGFSANYISTIAMNNVVFDQLLPNNVTPTSQYDAFTLEGNVYPAFLQSLPGTGVTYTGTATATAGAGVSACTNAFPYIVGDLYVSTATATSLQTATISAAGSVTLNALVEPAMSQVAYTGSAGASPAAAAPTAQVNFYEGTTLKGSASLGANGTIAPLTLSGLTAGTHTYTAQYPGDANYPALTFGSVTVTVTSATVATTTTLTAPATGAYGTGVTLSATVAGTPGTPTGSVGFYDGASLVGSATLASGTATLTGVIFAGGAHTLSAVYSGDATFVASTSTTKILTIATSASSTTVTASPTTVTQNATTTLMATVTGVSGATKPTGTVSFMDGTTSLGNAPLNGAGVATFTATMATVGSRTVTASYGGDGNYATSSNTVAVTVVAGSTTTALTAPSTAVYGVGQTLSAKVTAASGTPTGSVTFYDGTNAIGTGTLASATTSITGVVLAGGVHSLTAVYSGDSVNPASTSPVATFTVTVAASSTTLAITPTTAQAMSLVSLTATVNGVPAGVTPTGFVTFSDGSTVIGTGVLTGNVATLAAGLPFVGTRTITASYGGDTNYAVSSGTTAETVTAIPTTTTLAVSSTTAYDGGTVTLTATVSPATSGTVTFLLGGVSVGTGAVNASGVATLVYTLPASTVGGFLFTASYAASGAYGASVSAAQLVTVGTAFQFTSSASTVAIAPGASGTVTLSLTPGSGFSGTVTLTCASPVKYVTCTVANPSQTLSGTTTATSSATITVAATTSALYVRTGVVLAMMAPMGLLLFGMRKRKLLSVSLMVLMLVGVAALGGCSSGNGNGSTTASNVPTGAQVVTFTATAGTISQTVSVTVTFP